MGRGEGGSSVQSISHYARRNEQIYLKWHHTRARAHTHGMDQISTCLLSVLPVASRFLFFSSFVPPSDTPGGGVPSLLRKFKKRWDGWMGGLSCRASIFFQPNEQTNEYRLTAVHKREVGTQDTGGDGQYLQGARVRAIGNLHTLFA